MSSHSCVGELAPKLITVIVPCGRGEALLTRLAEEAGVLTATHHHARFVGGRRLKPDRMVFNEKDVVLVIVEAMYAEVLFELIYRESGVGEPHAGLMFMEKIMHVTPGHKQSFPLPPQ